MELRSYQSSAIAALWKHIEERDDNPCIVLPTGAGKSALIGQIAKDVHGWGGRVIFLSHVRELIKQQADHIAELAPDIPLGIYSAGLKARDLGYPITCAGIQSIYDKADQIGALDIIVVDEAHRIPLEGDGMYQSFLKAAKTANPSVRLVGLTATPYRTQAGVICRPDALLNHICYEIGIRELIRDGYLSPLKSKGGKQKHDVSRVAIRGGEFIQGDLERAMMSDEQKVILACLEIAEHAQDRKSVLVFCCGVDHARQVAGILGELGLGSVATVFGDTPSEERDISIQAFKKKQVKYLVNVEVLTTGFDAPAVDLVAILRPTMSAGLWYQMCGRGFRKAEGKADCKILDFGGNTLRHGPVEMLVTPKGDGKEPPKKAWKECPECEEVVSKGCEVCPDCGHFFPKNNVGRPINHDETAYNGQLEEEYAVEKVDYWQHRKKGSETAPPTMWVQYTCGLAQASEWICFEHQGFARRKAVQWWMTRNPSAPIPSTVTQALASIAMNGILEPKKIRLKAEGKYMRVEHTWNFEFRKKEGKIFNDSKEDVDIPF